LPKGEQTNTILLGPRSIRKRRTKKGERLSSENVGGRGELGVHEYREKKCVKVIPLTNRGRRREVGRLYALMEG